MIVVKFGGTSLAGTERLRAAARIVAAHHRDQGVVCVVSAMAGVTDLLLRTTELATTGATGWHQTLTELRARHEQTLTTLTTTTTIGAAVPTTALAFETAWAALEADFARLTERPFTTDAARAHAVAAFSGWGERLSVLLFSAALAAEGVPAEAFADEPVLLVERTGCRAETPAGAGPQGDDVPWEWLAPSVAATRETLSLRLAEPLAAEHVPVLPGYLARTADGLVTTLGRNGSDYSAAVVAAALGARALYIYSDVAGVHRADPRVVPEAELLPALTYADAAEIAALGARVLHPATLRPLAAAGIPLHLRGVFAPQAHGTDIGPAAHVHTLQGSLPAWVVVARPLTPDRPLFGTPADWEPGLVEVAGQFLRHGDLDAREDDHLHGTAQDAASSGPAGQPEDGPISGALALLAAAPRPLGLALSGRRISVAVPAEEAPTTQRRLYAALVRTGVRAVRRGRAPRIFGAARPAERRRSS